MSLKNIGFIGNERFIGETIVEGGNGKHYDEKYLINVEYERTDTGVIVPVSVSGENMDKESYRKCAVELPKLDYSNELHLVELKVNTFGDDPTIVFTDKTAYRIMLPYSAYSDGVRNKGHVNFILPKGVDVYRYNYRQFTGDMGSYLIVCTNDYIKQLIELDKATGEDSSLQQLDNGTIYSGFESKLGDLPFMEFSVDKTKSYNSETESIEDTSDTEDTRG